MHESPDAPQETRVWPRERADALAARAQSPFWDSRCLHLPGAEVTPNAPSIVAGFRPSGRPIEDRERSARSLPLEIRGNRPKLAPWKLRRKRILPHVDKNDFFLICGVTRDYQGWLPPDAWTWINEPKLKMAA